METKLEKNQELTKDLDIKLCRSQIMQKESSDELKKLQKESSNEITSLKKDISEIMNFLKNDKRVFIEQPEIIKSNNNGIVSTSDLCVPPKVMTSLSKSIITMDPSSVVKRTSEEAQLEEMSHSNSDLPATNNHNINIVDFSAAQTLAMDQSQPSDVEPSKEPLKETSENESTGFVKDMENVNLGQFSVIDLVACYVCIYVFQLNPNLP